MNSIFAVGVALFLAASAPAASTIEGCAGSLERVVDGDTVDVNCSTWNNLERLRLIGVDTPERGHDGFREATAFTKQWLADNPSFAVIYVEANNRIERDRWERVLALIYPADADSGAEATKRSLNAALLKSGHAETMAVKSNSVAVSFLTNEIGCVIVECHDEPIPTRTEP